MKPSLYDVTVAHVRRGDPPHSFAHRMYYWLVDLDELPMLPRWLRPFARFDPRDHFAPDAPGDIRSKVDEWLAGRGIDLDGGRVLMLANARVLGYVFNPITVYWCHRRDGEPVCVVAEVHNTYRGRHAYLLHPDERDEAMADKEFFVSPFQPAEGRYRMHLPRPGNLLTMTVSLRHGGRTALTATLRGVRRPATVGRVARTVLARPLVPQRIALLIRRHGVALWARGAAVTTPTTLTTPRVAGGKLHG